MVILKLRVRSADEWRELAPGDSVTDPMFVPTTDELEPGQQVIIEVSSQLLPNKVLIRGAVPGSKGAWILVRDAAKVALPANAPKPAAIRAVATDGAAKNDAPATEGAE